MELNIKKTSKNKPHTSSISPTTEQTMLCKNNNEPPIFERSVEQTLMQFNEFQAQLSPLEEYSRTESEESDATGCGCGWW
jgi:hypothetical protein